MECTNLTVCLACDVGAGKVLMGGVCVDGISCPEGCDTCDVAGIVCLSCQNGTNRQLVNGSCIAIDGYYTVNGTINALPCSFSCQTCQNTAG